MDAAAKTVESLSQHILPDKPHHLSYNPLWRFRPRPDDASRFEEWCNSRLQYMTLVSHADRGTVLTRSYYDMREEPPKPVPREVSALAKAGGDKKKKLSLSDYKNKRTGAVSSPPGPAVSKPKDSLPAPPLDAPKSTNADRHKPPSDLRKPDSQPPSSEARQHPPRDGAIDTSLPPKPPSLPPKPPSPSAKKRVADVDHEARPPKRPKPDDRKSVDRPPDLRRKERPHLPARDGPPPREERPSSSSSLPNGRVVHKGALHPTRNPSPGSRSRGDAVNGIRPHSSGGNISSVPAKSDTSKSYVPPLLSPLKLSFDGHSRPHPDEDDLGAKRDKRRDESGDAASAFKPVKKTEPSATSKKNKLVIPPLLSPTLPPIVEAELRRRKKASPESPDEKDKEVPGSKRRLVAGVNGEGPHRLRHRRRLLVVFAIPKHLRQPVKKIIGPSTDRRDAHARDGERGREPGKKRDRPGCDEASQANQARKRPAGSADGASEAVAAKRPQTSDMARVMATPSTPSKRSTAMSRVSSSNSMAQTPGEVINATPSVDRRANGLDASWQRLDWPEIKALGEREVSLKRKAVSLKHDSDQAMRNPHGSPSDTGAWLKPGESQIKLKYALCVESIIAFVMSFQAQNAWRTMSNKPTDYHSWDSVLPLLEHTQNEMRTHGLNSKPLYVLLLLLHSIVLDEVLKGYSNLDSPTTHISLEAVLRLERKRARIWPTIREQGAHIADPALRVDASPWFSIDDITGAGLRILRTWCSEERVDNWTPEPMLKDLWPINPRHPLHPHIAPASSQRPC